MSTYRISLKPGADLDGFRTATRRLIAQNAAPHEVSWQGDEQTLLFGEEPPDATQPILLSQEATDLIETVVCHRTPERYAYLYEFIWRLTRGEKSLLRIHTDPLVHRLSLMAKAIRRDVHKMHAFLRFRCVKHDQGERFVAWFEPDHLILQRVAPFFINRFRSLEWAIFTPIGSLYWDRERIAVGPAGRRSDAPQEDEFEESWLGYYESVFNPARTNPRAMRAEMPKKYWRNLPEAASIPRLIRTAEQQTRQMIERAPTLPRKRDPAKAVAALAVPAVQTLAELNQIIAASDPMVIGGKRAVLGEGPERAAIAFVGEQPGDQEDLRGRPFVGPAGQLLRRAIADAGIDLETAYLTNAVKHFKFQQRGKRRIHQKPTASEISHYRWWLLKELEFVRPAVVVGLGASAVFALTEKLLPIMRSRGPTAFGAHRGYITMHPSYLLRLADEEAREQGYVSFVEDLRRSRDLFANRADLHSPAAG